MFLYPLEVTMKVLNQQELNSVNGGFGLVAFGAGIAAATTFTYLFAYTENTETVLMRTDANLNLVNTDLEKPGLFQELITSEDGDQAVFIYAVVPVVKKVVSKPSFLTIGTIAFTIGTAYALAAEAFIENYL